MFTKSFPLLLIFALLHVAGAVTIYVPDDYPTIQSAVNNASDGYVIVVRDGHYYENVDVSVAVTIMSENGSSKCIIEAEKKDHVFKIGADNVSILGFTITGAEKRKACIKIESASNVLISGNVIRDCYYGVYIRGTKGNPSFNANVSHNRIFECEVGIKFFGAGVNGAEVFGNEIFNCSYGVYLTHAKETEFEKNVIFDNDYGLYLKNADENSIIRNWIHSNDVGIHLKQKSEDNLIRYNNIIDNGEWQLYNDQCVEVDAKFNYWGLFDNESIDASIYDDEEKKCHKKSGEVKFYPFLTNPAPSAPIPELSTLLLTLAGLFILGVSYRR